mmetsp:Transcript_21603/g.53299  ORF Transcript_21603/g.53299 Transcript_21603/m.53299 type:complete len:142 (+) Transcript_21603:159-584(+)
MPLSTVAMSIYSTSSPIRAVAYRWREDWKKQRGVTMSAKGLFEMLSGQQGFVFKMGSVRAGEAERLMVALSDEGENMEHGLYDRVMSETERRTLGQVKAWALEYIPNRAAIIRKKKIMKFHPDAGDDTINLEVIFYLLQAP